MSKRECVRRNRWIELWLLSALFISTAVQAVPCAGIQTSIDAGSAAEQLDQTLRIYQPLVEKSIAYRQASLQLANELKHHLDVGRPLTGKQLEQLNLGTRAHLDLRQALYGVAYQYECWLDDRMDKKAGMTSSLRLQGVMISLSAALVLYDNYLLAVSIFQDDVELRRAINASDSGYRVERNELEAVGKAYHKLDNYLRVQRAIRFYQAQIDSYRQTIEDDEDFAYLYQLIEQSPSYRATFDGSPLRHVDNKMNFLFASVGDRLNGITSEGMNLLSGLFGNTVGLVETRKGKLYGRPQLESAVISSLTAGDILLEKTPFRLTDKLIPGHWGHVAIWIGSESELKALGIWDHPLILPWQAKIRQRHGVIEALRTGVTINPLSQFLNVDDLAVIRAADLSLQQRREVLLRAFRQIGKQYDFNFDLETTDRIVCSELVYTVYVDREWPVKKMLGRYTISPDHVADMVFNSPSLQLVALYHDGERVSARAEEKMQQLMAKR
ncbi:MAG: Poxvirus G6 [Candidatus Thiodiazotropha sp. (ex Epidulcina cf. delphinae)]|nr:Poxvirus G6 [Candidatus Thiodiazotropha sp. (ex Epidulcina cf. delphinae)]